MQRGPFDLLKFLFANLAVVGLAGCATAPLDTSGSLSSYDGLAPAAGVLTQSKLRVDKPDILAAKSVTIVPTSFSGAASRADLTDKQRRVIANAVDRSVCIDLSDRFDVVPVGQPADLTVHVTVTHVTVTDPAIAGVSKAASIAPMFITTGVPIVVPRIPFGMGSLSVEAEARDSSGQQRAALVWARGADVLTSKPRVAASGDAYDLASEFGADFSKLLVTGDSPFDHQLSLPSAQRVQSSLGGKPKNAACDAFGRTGIPAFIAGRMGAPPEWADDAMPVAN
jgi:hypothetical protein